MVGVLLGCKLPLRRWKVGCVEAFRAGRTACYRSARVLSGMALDPCRFVKSKILGGRKRPPIMLWSLEQGDVVHSLGSPSQLLQLAVCCNQAHLDSAAKPASKAAARRVWTAADKGNKLKGEATSSASASASASDKAPVEEKAIDTATPESYGRTSPSTHATLVRILTLLR